MRSDARVLTVVAAAQSVAFGALTLIAFGVFGLAVLFGVADAPASASGRHEVARALAVLALVVVVPAVLSVLLLLAAVWARRSPRVAAIALLVAEPAGAVFLLWPTLRGYLFQLPPTTAAAVVVLVLTVPGLVVAVRALASNDAASGLPDPRRAGAAPPVARRH